MHGVTKENPKLEFCKKKKVEAIESETHAQACHRKLERGP